MVPVFSTRSLFPKHPEYEQRARIAFLKAWKRLMKGAAVIQALFSPDPWRIFNHFGVRVCTPIPHEKNDSRPVEVPLSADAADLPVMTTAYVVSDLKIPERRKVLPDEEALGAEDFELGLRVSPEFGQQPQLEQLWRAT